MVMVTAEPAATAEPVMMEVEAAVEVAPRPLPAPPAVHGGDVACAVSENDAVVP